MKFINPCKSIGTQRLSNFIAKNPAMHPNKNAEMKADKFELIPTRTAENPGRL
jgi:hypothetical protein